MVSVIIYVEMMCTGMSVMFYEHIYVYKDKKQRMYMYNVYSYLFPELEVFDYCVLRLLKLKEGLISSGLFAAYCKGNISK